MVKSSRLKLELLNPQQIFLFPSINFQSLFIILFGFSQSFFFLQAQKSFHRFCLQDFFTFKIVYAEMICSNLCKLQLHLQVSNCIFMSSLPSQWIIFSSISFFWFECKKNFIMCNGRKLSSSLLFMKMKRKVFYKIFN